MVYGIECMVSSIWYVVYGIHILLEDQGSYNQAKAAYLSGF